MLICNLKKSPLTTSQQTDIFPIPNLWFFFPCLIFFFFLFYSYFETFYTPSLILVSWWHQQCSIQSYLSDSVTAVCTAATSRRTNSVSPATSMQVEHSSLEKSIDHSAHIQVADVSVCLSCAHKNNGLTCRVGHRNSCSHLKAHLKNNNLFTDIFA